MNGYRLLLTLCNLLLISLLGCSDAPFDVDAKPSVGYAISFDVIPYDRARPVMFTSEGNTLYGFYVTQADSLSIPPHPVILYHHDAHGNIQDHWDRVELLWRAGFSIFIYDYRGFGLSEGATHSHTTMYADALAAHDMLDQLRPQVGADSALLVQYGYGIGGPLAIHVANKHQMQAVVLESAHSAFNALDEISQVKARLLILHGTHDAEAHAAFTADLLFHNAVNPKTIIKVEEAGHTNIPNTLGQQAYIDLITTFIRGS